MPALARGQENDTSILNWFITVNGVLTDAYAVEFQIFDITGGLPGSQVFPSTPGDYEPVTNAPGHFSTGSYHAYDNGNAQGWTPGLAEPVGTHRIAWRWKISSTAPWQESFEDFEVLVQSAGSSVDTYCSVQDIRDQGIDVTIADDDTVLAYIETWQQFLDRACGQWFNPRSMILSLDGTDSDTLHFGVPIIQIDYIKLNDSGAELDPGYYRAYTARRYPDDRKNPRIKLVGPADFVDIYSSPVRFGRRLWFIKGRQNQEVKGIFGYTEEDGSTPKLIRRALMKLVVEKLSRPIYQPPAGGTTPTIPPILGAILEEETDDHRIKYAQPGGESNRRAPGLTGITEDREILDIITLYKRPQAIAVAAGWSYGI